MKESIELIPTSCAICSTQDNAAELYAANFGPRSFNPRIFSARRLPDRIHYRMVKCRKCGLVRADPIANSELLAKLYSQSSFDYTDEIGNLKLTYGRYLAKLTKYGVKKGAMLEIGCGNGFFLEEALAQRFDTVRGVEPSSEAFRKADAYLQKHIICDIMRPGLFDSGQFDVICMFQVLDHIPEPEALLRECLRILKPGGFMLCINHNIESLTAKLLKDRSPVIDIEHIFLYSFKTMRRIFSACGFKVTAVNPAYNVYSIYYLAWLLPLPSKIKGIILNFLRHNSIGQIRLSVPLGNLYLIAQKP